MAIKTESLPPLEFGYSRFEPEERDFFPLLVLILRRPRSPTPDYELVDLFGNGCRMCWK